MFMGPHIRLRDVVCITRPKEYGMRILTCLPARSKYWLATVRWASRSYSACILCLLWQTTVLWTQEAIVHTQGLQLKWHLREFFFLAAVGLTTSIAAAVVLWRNIGSMHKAPILTALASGYMALLLHGFARWGSHRKGLAEILICFCMCTTAPAEHTGEDILLCMLFW